MPPPPPPQDGKIDISPEEMVKFMRFCLAQTPQEDWFKPISFEKLAKIWDDAIANNGGKKPWL